MQPPTAKASVAYVGDWRARLRGTPLHDAVRSVRAARERLRWRLERTSSWGSAVERRQADALRDWRARPGAGAPPALVKQAIVKEYARRFGLAVLVETGTLHGDMIEGTRRIFQRVVSVELAPHLARRATARFAAQPSVTILEGDSANVLPQVLAQLEEPALFWLDGHYSGDDTARGDQETPVRTELAAVLAHPVRDHVILIDDARAFGRGDYPTIDEIRAIVASSRPEFEVAVADDIIRIHPAAPVAESR